LKVLKKRVLLGGSNRKIEISAQSVSVSIITII